MRGSDRHIIETDTLIGGQGHTFMNLKRQEHLYFQGLWAAGPAFGILITVLSYQKNKQQSFS